MSDQFGSSRKTQERVIHLSNIDFFEDLSQQALLNLSHLMKEVHYKKDSIIINQGEETRSLFIIESGRIKVTALNEEGHQTVFSFLQQDEYFGELSLIDEAPRSATIIAVEDTDVLVLSHSQFYSFLNSHPEANWSLFKALTARIRDMDDTISTLTSKDIYGRLAARIYKEAKGKINGYLVTRKLTHQDLAEMIGCSREMVSRIFKRLKNEGYIKVEEKRIIIIKDLPNHL